MIKIIKQYKYYILSILFLFLFFVYSIKINTNPVEDDLVLEKKEVVEEQKNTKIMVDIKGAVVNPGVYELETGKRVLDVIASSGGLLENADTSYLNLSKQIENEMVIIIYSKEEIMSMAEGNTAVKYIDKECVCPSIKNDGCLGDKKITNAKESGKQSAESGVVHLNTATKEELMSLSGIGESKANLIMEYRAKTPFTTVEEIKKVKGIGDSIFEKIKSRLAL